MLFQPDFKGKSLSACLQLTSAALSHRFLLADDLPAIAERLLESSHNHPEVLILAGMLPSEAGETLNRFDRLCTQAGIKQVPNENYNRILAKEISNASLNSEHDVLEVAGTIARLSHYRKNIDQPSISSGMLDELFPIYAAIHNYDDLTESNMRLKAIEDMRKMIDEIKQLYLLHLDDDGTIRNS